MPSAKTRETVRLRPPRCVDAEPLWEAIRESRKELSRWMAWLHPRYGVADAPEWIARGARGRRLGTELDFLVVDDAKRILGTCALNQIRPEHRLANLGYWIRTSAAGRGVATAAVRQIAELAFRETDLVRLEIVVAEGNRASQKVAEKSGALFEGVVGDRILIRGELSDARMYALLRSRWKKTSERSP